MNVTNFANLFHQNNVFQQNRPLGQMLNRTPVNDTLNRLSENLLTAQAQTKDLKARFDTLELSAEAVAFKETSALEDVPEGLLRFYLHMCRFGASLSQGQEDALTEYREQLSAFDQTIEAYQDMLGGKTALPEHMRREDAALLLEATKAAREQFLQEGAKELNRLSKERPLPKELLGSGYAMITGRTEDDFARWQIDPSAKNIYEEIDRALASAHEVTSVFQDGAAGILAELKRRGVWTGEEPSLDAQEPADSGAAARASLFQDVYDSIWSMLRKSAAELRE
ncbi:MAG: hypothetical protein HFF18_04585 [Oscillospiraceae bacterium]|nr:hypothetical protein [Oscillospiraceae bacterium]